MAYSLKIRTEVINHVHQGMTVLEVSQMEWSYAMKQLKDKEYEEFQQYQYNKVHGYIWTPDTLELICRGNEYDPERIGKQMLEMKVKLQNEHIIDGRELPEYMTMNKGKICG